MGALTQTFIDYNGDRGTVQIHGRDVTAANFAAQEALWEAMRDAVNGLSECNLDAYSVTVKRAPQNAAKPDTKTAQRETKWLVLYHDSVSMEKGRYEIPGAKLSLLADHSESIDKASAAYIAFNAAFVAYAIGAGGEVPVIDDIVFTTRR